LTREFDRSIKQIGDIHGLQYRKANKALMAKFGIDRPIFIIHVKEIVATT
jgi:hypothetical protein